MRVLSVVAALVAAGLCLCLPFRPVDAGTALRLDVDGLVQHSELVVEARVLSAVTVEPAGGILSTEFLLEVRRTFKGQDLAYRTVRLPGGVRADGSGLLIPGMPHVVPGEDVLLFLGPEAPAARGAFRMPTGLAQGKLALHTLPDGRRELVGDLTGLRLAGADGKTVAGREVVRDYAWCVARIEAALARENASETAEVGR
jgi:hypothetical protein